MARRNSSFDEEIRPVLEVQRGEEAIAELCQKKSINRHFYCRRTKEFHEAIKRGRFWLNDGSRVRS